MAPRAVPPSLPVCGVAVLSPTPWWRVVAWTCEVLLCFVFFFLGGGQSNSHGLKISVFDADGVEF